MGVQQHSSFLVSLTLLRARHDVSQASKHTPTPPKQNEARRRRTSSVGLGLACAQPVDSGEPTAAALRHRSGHTHTLPPKWHACTLDAVYEPCTACRGVGASLTAQARSLQWPFTSTWLFLVVPACTHAWMHACTQAQVLPLQAHEAHEAQHAGASTPCTRQMGQA